MKQSLPVIEDSRRSAFRLKGEGSYDADATTKGR